MAKKYNCSIFIFLFLDCGYLARHSALKAGVPQNVPACTINRLCGSGFQSIVYGAQEIALGDSKVALCGGTENMSLAPYMLRGNRFGTRLGTDLILEDLLWGGKLILNRK